MASFSGADMRCPQCNRYLPDRCTCNGPSLEEQRLAGAEAIRQTLGIPKDIFDGNSPTRLTQTSPNLQQIPVAIDPRLLQAAIDRQRAAINDSIDLAAAETRLLAHLAENLGAAAAAATLHLNNLTSTAPRWFLPEPPFRDSPAGIYAGQFSVIDGGTWRYGVSGNARQRRRVIRAWKRLGYTVQQTNAATGDIITR